MKKNKEIKVASAKDIYEYLRGCAGADNVAHASKRDVARHFGYKSSNGDGFLANFKFLEDSNLIEDVSINKRNGAWKVNSANNFVFPDKCESVRNKNKEKSHISLLSSNDVKVEYLKPIDYNGRQYIPLINIAQAFNIDKHSVYNAGASTNKIVSAYMQMISIGDKSQPKKSIELEGLTYLFERLKKKVKPEILSAAINYVEDAYLTVNTPNDVDSKEIEESLSDVEASPVNETVIERDSNIFEDAEQINIDLSNESDESNLPSDTNDRNVVNNISLTGFDSNSDDLSDMLNVLDGILGIISEHKDLKTEVAILKEENSELKNQIAVLSEEVSHKGADPEEIEKLNNKIASLENELAIANKTSSEIMARANLIRNYVKENQVVNNQ